MAVIGIQLNRENPTFTKDDFTFWMPQFAGFMATCDGDKYFNKIYNLVNGKIFKSIYGSDWELAMSLGMAHYLTLIGQQMQVPAGQSLSDIAGGGNIKGVLASMSVGSFSKSYDLSKTMVESDDAMFWNQTSYGAQLMALLKTKAIPAIAVVTSNPLYERGCCNESCD